MHFSPYILPKLGSVQGTWRDDFFDEFYHHDYLATISGFCEMFGWPALASMDSERGNALSRHSDDTKSNLEPKWNSTCLKLVPIHRQVLERSVFVLSYHSDGHKRQYSVSPLRGSAQSSVEVQCMLMYSALV